MANEELFEKAIALLREELSLWEHYPGSEGRIRRERTSTAIADLSAGNISESVLRALNESGRYYLNLCNFARNPEQLKSCGLPQATIDDWVKKRETNGTRSTEFFILYESLLDLATSAPH